MYTIKSLDLNIPQPSVCGDCPYFKCTRNVRTNEQQFICSLLWDKTHELFVVEENSMLPVCLLESHNKWHYYQILKYFADHQDEILTTEDMIQIHRDICAQSMK